MEKTVKTIKKTIQKLGDSDYVNVANVSETTASIWIDHGLAPATTNGNKSSLSVR